MTLKQLRKRKKLTQVECAEYLRIPLRTYQSYENAPEKQNSIKYSYMMQMLDSYGFTDETHGILPIQEIKDICGKVFSEYDVGYCYLFGSYAKGNATDSSDIDLLLSATITGIKFYDLVETLREKLQKKVDVLTLEQLNNNPELLNEILKDGIKIYG